MASAVVSAEKSVSSIRERAWVRLVDVVVRLLIADSSRFWPAPSDERAVFTLDSARLDAALEANPSAVAALFTLGPRGVFATVDQFARESTLIADPGSLGGSLRRFESQLESSDERLAKIAEQKETLRQRLTRDFIASERRVAASQSTLDFLRLQFAPRDNN